MRKNLFLALALVFASFATVNAQWSQTLSAVDGLPGIVDATTNCKIVKTGLITPSSPVSGVRLTICDTQTPELNAGTTMAAFAEIKVIDGEGNELKITPTSNSIQTGGADGGGMAALVDNNYSTYYHSFWGNGVSNAEGEYVYIDLAFEKEVSSFRLMWAGRSNSHKFSPTVAVLTPVGVPGVPGEVEEAEPAAFELGERITSMDELLAAPYVALKGNTPKEFTKDKEEYSWIGARFITGTGNDCWVAVDSTHLYGAAMAMQIVPSAAEDGTYNFYWPEYNAYIADYAKYDPNRGGLGTVTNDVFWQDWQIGSSNVDHAADIEITVTDNGQFRFTYYTTLSDEAKTEDIAWIAAEPRDAGNRALKVFNGNLAAQLQSGDYTKGYGLPVSFDFDFYACEYSAAKHLYKSELNSQIFDAFLAAATYGGLQESEDSWGIDPYYDYMIEGTEIAQDLIDSDASYEECMAQVEAMKANLINYLYTIALQRIDDIYNIQDELEEAGLFCPADELEVGKYTYESFEAVSEFEDRFYMLTGDIEDFGALYTYYTLFVEAFAEFDAALATFYNGKITATAWPVMFGTEDGLHVTGATAWRSPVIRPDFVGMNSFRITFLEVGPNNGKYNDYPMVCLSEFAVYDAAGNKIPLTEANITCNSVETSEGSIANLFDGERSTFFHSIWGNGTFDPVGYVYFDVELPDTYVGFQIEWIARDHSNPFSPKKVYVGPYGETYDPIAESANDYNVSLGAQVRAASEIQDWGVYAIQGLLNNNTVDLTAEEVGKARYYGGRTPFHTSVLREDCAYFFTKNGDGTFNIRSLKSSKFWAADATEVNTTADAADVNIVPSTNAAFAGQNTFVLYTLDAESKLSASWEYSNEETGESINVAAVEVATPYNVFMDWDGGLAQRNCVAPQPGITDTQIYGEQAENVALVTARLQAKSSAGDYLHFNKTNGEGEWKIYRLTMDNPYYYWLTSLVGIADNMGLIVGPNPGQFQNIGTFAADYAAAQAVIEANNYAGAEAAAKQLASTLEASTSGELVRNPITEGVYIIEAAHRGYNRNKAMYLKDNGDGTYDLAWGNKPTDYTTEEGKKFLFELETSIYVDDLINDKVISEEERDNVYFIKSVANGLYVLTMNEGIFGFNDDNQAAVSYIFKRGTTDIYTINSQGQGHLHQEGHGEGAGNGGDVVYWNGSAIDTSASAWRLIKYVEEDGTIGDLDGDDKVEVSDITLMVSMILDSSLATDAADLDGDGVVEVSDITVLVELVLGTSAASEAPKRAATRSTGATSSFSVDGDGETLLFNVANPSYAFAGIQFDLYLPEGIEVVNDGEYYDVFKGSRAKRSHVDPSCAIQPDGALRVLLYSSKNDNFTGTEGDVATADLMVTTAADGEYEFEVKYISISAPGSKEYLNNWKGYITVADGVTGIDFIVAENESADATIYDLFGRKVTETVKGKAYIQNGKKFIAQ